MDGVNGIILVDGSCTTVHLLLPYSEALMWLPLVLLSCLPCVLVTPCHLSLLVVTASR